MQHTRGQHFDVAVIGMQRSGLVAAALLAKRGRRVLLVDHGEDALAYRRHGLVLPLVPRLAPDLSTAPHIRRIFDELALEPMFRTHVVGNNPIFQAILPTHRVDISGNRETLLAELRAEFPEVAGAIDSFFDRLYALDEELSRYLDSQPPLPPSGIFQRLKARSVQAHMGHLAAPFEDHDLLADIPEDHPVRELLLAPLTFFGNASCGEPSTFHAVRLIAQYYRGALSFPDRLGELTTVLTSAASETGVDIRRGAVIRDLEVGRRRIMSFGIDGEHTKYSADFFISNTLGQFHELLPPGKAHSKLMLEEQVPQEVGTLLVLNLVVATEAIPKGMSEALFLLNGRRQRRGAEPSDPPLFLRRYPAMRGALGTLETSQSIIDTDREVFSIACPVNTADVSHSPGEVKRLQAAMRSRVRRLVPYLEENIVDASLAVETGGWDPAADQATARRVDPWRVHPIYDVPKGPNLGIAGRPTRTWLKNLLHCGADVVPGLGTEGEYVTGIAVADTLGRMAGKKWQQPHG